MKIIYLVNFGVKIVEIYQEKFMKIIKYICEENSVKILRSQLKSCDKESLEEEKVSKKEKKADSRLQMR